MLSRRATETAGNPAAPVSPGQAPFLVVGRHLLVVLVDELPHAGVRGVAIGEEHGVHVGIVEERRPDATLGALLLVR